MKGTHNGFHGITQWQAKGKEGEQISARVAKGLDNLVCGMRDCKCGEHIAIWDGGDKYYLPDTSDIRGHYPQA